jgi:hypothetical protein
LEKITFLINILDELKKKIKIRKKSTNNRLYKSDAVGNDLDFGSTSSPSKFPEGS